MLVLRCFAYHQCKVVNQKGLSQPVLNSSGLDDTYVLAGRWAQARELDSSQDWSAGTSRLASTATRLPGWAGSALPLPHTPVLGFVRAELAASACVLRRKYTERRTDRSCETRMSPEYHPSTAMSDLSFPYYNKSGNSVVVQHFPLSVQNSSADPLGLRYSTEK